MGFLHLSLLCEHFFMSLIILKHLYCFLVYYMDIALKTFSNLGDYSM